MTEPEKADRIASFGELRLGFAVVSLMAVIVAVLLTAPFYVMRNHRGSNAPDSYGLPQTHDMAQHISVMKQVHEAVRSGDLYPRWQSEFNKGYGLPWLTYYPPGFYFVAELFFLVMGNWHWVLFVVTTAFMAGSGIAFFALTRQFHSDAASAIGALFYMMAPYHTLDLYWRGALPELTGFVFVPLIVLLAFRTGRDGRPWQIAGLGLAQGLFMLFHFPVSYLLLPALGLYSVVWAAMRNEWRIAARIAAGVLVGFGVSACYWLVALLERKHVWQPFAEIFPYHSSYLTFLPQIDAFNQIVTRSASMLVIALVVSIVIARSARLDRRFRRLQGQEAHAPGTQVRLFRWLAVATCFMLTPYSDPVASLIPNIDAVSFAWRWLVLATCFTALAFAAAVDVVFLQARRRERRTVYGLAVVMVFALSLLTSIQLVRPVFAASNPNLQAPIARMENGFRPGRAGDAESLPDTERVVLEPPGGGTARVAEWSPVRREVLLDLREARRVRLRTYKFRGWTARIDGRVVPIESDPDIAQLVRVPAGKHRLVVTFGNVRTVTAVETISVLAILGALATIVVDGSRSGRHRAKRTVS